jgi:LuxR family maltose regulon positive regulatory protein
MALESRKESEQAAQAMVDALRMSAQAGVVRSFTDEGKSCETVLKAVRAKLDGQPEMDDLRPHLERILTAFGPFELPSRDAAPLQQEISSEFGSTRLSMRERDVLQFLAQGMPNKRIATTMNVSVDTVKWHLKNIFGKLDAADRFQAIDKARRAGLIPRQP